jgi:hypothetical protein
MMFLLSAVTVSPGAACGTAGFGVAQQAEKERSNDRKQSVFMNRKIRGFIQPPRKEVAKIFLILCARLLADRLFAALRFGIT